MLSQADSIKTNWPYTVKVQNMSKNPGMPKMYQWNCPLQRCPSVLITCFREKPVQIGFKSLLCWHGNVDAWDSKTLHTIHPRILKRWCAWSKLPGFSDQSHFWVDLYHLGPVEVVTWKSRLKGGWNIQWFSGWILSILSTKDFKGWNPSQITTIYSLSVPNTHKYVWNGFSDVPMTIEKKTPWGPSLTAKRITISSVSLRTPQSTDVSGDSKPIQLPSLTRYPAGYKLQFNRGLTVDHPPAKVAENQSCHMATRHGKWNLRLYTPT